MLKQKLLKVALWSGVLLLIPLVIQLTVGTGIDGQGWNWKPGDFVFAWVVWFAAGASYQVLASRTTDTNRKIVYGILVFLVLAFVWAGAATNFDGLEERINQLLQIQN